MSKPEGWSIHSIAVQALELLITRGEDRYDVANIDLVGTGSHAASNVYWSASGGRGTVTTSGTPSRYAISRPNAASWRVDCSSWFRNTAGHSALILIAGRICHVGKRCLRSRRKAAVLPRPIPTLPPPPATRALQNSGGPTSFDGMREKSFCLDRCICSARKIR